MPKTYSSPPGTDRRDRVACPGCGGSDARLLLRCEGFDFVRCRHCSLVYQNPRPAAEVMLRRYGVEYFSYELANERAYFGLMSLGLRDIRFRERAERLPLPRRFLDVGCATGILIESLKGEGWDVLGVDVCRESADYGRSHRGVDIITGTLEEARLAKGSFGVVHFSHLIEHVPDQRAFLAEVGRVLAPGGLAVVTTPNIDGLQARLFGSRWRSAIADHLVLFSRRTLLRMLGESGFDEVQTVTWGGLAKGTAPAWLKAPVDRLAKALGFGDVMLCCAQKRPGS